MGEPVQLSNGQSSDEYGGAQLKLKKGSVEKTEPRG
jgi:hypothetical protein